MDLQDYLRVIRKRWPTILLTLLAVAALAGAYVWTAPRTYQATSQVFVSTTNSDTSADLASGTTFMTKQIKTYADVVTSPTVLDPVRAKLGVDGDLAESITATVPPDTVLIDIAVTDRDKARTVTVADAVAQQLTKTVATLQAGNAAKSPVKVTVVRPAATPTAPISPRPVRTMALAVVLGSLLGLGLALLREMLDTSVKGEDDVKALTDTTIIGGIQYDSSASSSPLVVQGDPHSPRAEAFRSLRTNLQFVDAASRPRVVVVTSSLPGEGKTTTAANLALTMGASGASVCMVEGDLRRPRLLEYMGLEGGVGLTSVLIGEAALDDVLQPYGDNVVALGAGPIPPNPSELLGSPAMASLLDELRARFDHVIIDAPPLLPVTDAAVVSRISDGAIVVVGRGVVKREHVARALENLDAVDARVLGIVMNRMPTRGVDGYSYYGSRYAYTSEPTRRETRRARRAREKRADAAPAATARDRVDA